MARKLPGNYLIELESFEFLTYENGRPKDWISTVDAYHEGELAIDSFPIEVNKPLKIGNIEVFQSSYREETRIALSEADGTVHTLTPGKSLEVVKPVT